MRLGNFEDLIIIFLDLFLISKPLGAVGFEIFIHEINRSC
jgi:hypothetical protein